MTIFDSRPVRDVIGVVFFLLFLALLVLGVARCKPVDDPGAQHRAIVQGLAYGVRAADQACASLARGAPVAREGYELARDCAFAYDAARVSLDAADEALDGEGEQDVSCHVAQALAYAQHMAALIEKKGGKLPKALVQAFSLAPMLGGLCHG